MDAIRLGSIERPPVGEVQEQIRILVLLAQEMVLEAFQESFAFRKRLRDPPDFHRFRRRELDQYPVHDLHQRLEDTHAPVQVRAQGHPRNFVRIRQDVSPEPARTRCQGRR